MCFISSTGHLEDPQNDNVTPSEHCSIVHTEETEGKMNQE